MCPHPDPHLNYNRTPRLRRSTGFTLLELVLVLAVLAILTGIAVTSLTGVQDQTRFDVTQRQLANIQSAIDGDSGLRHPDGSNIPNGFVADMGRLPKLIGTDQKTQLQDLWTPPLEASQLFGIKPAPAPDQDIQIGTGWRGPYLQLPFGQQQLVDGWGNAYSINAPTNTPLASLAGLQSFGSDNAAGSTSSDVYAADLPATPLLFTAGSYSTTVICVVPTGSTQPLSGKLFQPDTNGGVASVLATVTTSNGTTTLTFTGVAPGSRAIRTYSDSASTSPLTTQYVTVPKGGLLISTTATTQPTASGG